MTTVKLKDQGIEVRKLQLLLNSFATPNPPLTINGYFDQRMEQTLKIFQSTKGLSPDGQANTAVRDALGLNAVPVPTTIIIAPSAPWLDIAVAELGVHEDSRPGKHTARILEYHKTTTLKATTDETPWCSSFVNWVMIQSGRKGTNSALAKSWLNWGRAVTTSQRGAIIVIKKKTTGFTNATGSNTGYHVGFYLSSTATSVQILGGNQSDRVKKSNFMLSSYEIKGYRIP